MRFVLAALHLLCWNLCLAQSTYPFPRNYFRDPLDIPITLAGNFGELRANHFHMGLDIKTQHRQNLTVRAAADGWVARVKVEPFGFGRAIYINHPNGYTTVYCHLNRFYPELEAWLNEQQYEQESWAVYLDLPPGRFRVRKGQMIAYSGTTGGSLAPHLHFEIRRTVDDMNMNPILFGLPLSDQTRPRILRLALYNRSRSLYDQSPRILPVKYAGAGRYTCTPSLVTVPYPHLSVGISAYDTQSGSANHNGIFYAGLEMDGSPVIHFTLDSISYNDTRYVNAHVDYRTRSRGGPFIQLLTELPGYIHSIYTKDSGDGVLDLSDGKRHQVRILVKDAYGNSSTIGVRVQYRPGAVQQGDPPGKMFYPFMLDGYESDHCEFYIGERCLYDSVRVTYKEVPATATMAVSDIHQIGSPAIPLQEAMLVRIRPLNELSKEEKAHTVMQWFSGSDKEVERVSWKDNWASAHFREFGSFQLVVDREAPEIIPSGFSDGSDLSRASRVVFRVKDNLGSLAGVRAELDGKWICFSNDKAKAFIYHFDEHWPKGRHELKIEAVDAAGNRTVRTYSLFR